MAGLSREEAVLLKQEIRRELLTSVIITLEKRLRERIGAANMDEIARAFKELQDRTDIDDYLYLEINDTGLHVLDRQVEFHL